MTQHRRDHGDDSTMSYSFWASVKVLIIYLRVLFFVWISALMPPNQVYHSFSRKKCINLCCNSVCRNENVVGHMPRGWQFNGLPNNLPPGKGTSVCFMVWKAQGDQFKNTYEKKIGEWFYAKECIDYQKNAHFVRITQEYLYTYPRK